MALACSRRIRGSALARVSAGLLAPRLPPLYTPCRPLAGKSSDDKPKETVKKPIVTTLDVLQLTKHDAPRFVGVNDLISEAMHRMEEHRISSLVVRDAQDRVVGFLTQRDLLCAIVRRGVKDEYSGESTGWNVAVSQVMTPSKDLVYLSPTDTIEDARSLMAVSGKRHIPVLSGSTLLGILNPKDIAKYIHLATERSAKAEYVTMVMPRKGMPLGTKLKADGPAAGTPGVHVQLHSAVCLLPHPNKVETGGEDAYLLGPHMIGVADGVGALLSGGGGRLCLGWAAALVRVARQMGGEEREGTLARGYGAGLLSGGACPCEGSEGRSRLCLGWAEATCLCVWVAWFGGGGKCWQEGGVSVRC
jgi:CBS domain-containing protein